MGGVGLVASKKASSPQKYQLPEFLEGRVGRTAYIRWLSRKAAAHVKRDRKRKSQAISAESYKLAIHEAVQSSAGIDWYTGEKLRWEIISTYNNEASKEGRSQYKAQFALLPTVDHVLTTAGQYDFVVCSWRTNDSKNDLSLKEFVELCRRVMALHGNITSPSE